MSPSLRKNKKQHSDAPTLREISVLAGVSQSTVSRVLTNDPRISPETREKVEAVIKSSGYRPSIFARALAGRSTGMIAVIAPGIVSGYFAEVLSGINAGAASSGKHLMCSFSHSDADYIELWHNTIAQRLADAVILLDPPKGILSLNPPGEGSRTVLCSCREDDLTRPWASVPSVTVNNFEAFRSLVLSLAGQGLRTFLHLAGPENIYDAGARAKGFMDGIASSHDASCKIIYGGLGFDSAELAFLEYMKSNRAPDAVVCVNDTTAWGVMSACEKLGLQPGKDIAVSGCDDVMPASFIGLTTFSMPMYRMGGEAASIASRLCDGTKASGIQMELSLILRKTTDLYKNGVGK